MQFEDNISLWWMKNYDKKNNTMIHKNCLRDNKIVFSDLDDIQVPTYGKYLKNQRDNPLFH